MVRVRRPIVLLGKLESFLQGADCCSRLRITCRKVGLTSAEDRMITEIDSLPSADSKRALSGVSFGWAAGGMEGE